MVGLGSDKARSRELAHGRRDGGMDDGQIAMNQAGHQSEQVCSHKTVQKSGFKNPDLKVNSSS